MCGSMIWTKKFVFFGFTFFLFSLWMIFLSQNASEFNTIRWSPRGISQMILSSRQISQMIFKENPNEVRLQNLKHWCLTRNQAKTQPHSSNETLYGCYVYPPRQIILCLHPKVACTTWKTLMIVSTEKFRQKFPQWKNVTELTDEIHEKIGYVHNKLLDYGWMNITDNGKVNDKFQGYFKAVFVREPYDRLLSAFVNKIESGLDATYRWIYIDRLRARFGNNVTDLKNITFNSFLHNVVYEYQNNILDEHWTPYTKLLDPCHVDFDMIGRFETMEKDARVVLKHLFVRNFSLPVTNKTPLKNFTAYYDNVDRAVLRKIRQYFYDDFLAYGYDPDLHI